MALETFACLFLKVLPSLFAVIKGKTLLGTVANLVVKHLATEVVSGSLKIVGVKGMISKVLPDVVGVITGQGVERLIESSRPPNMDMELLADDSIRRTLGPPLRARHIELLEPLYKVRRLDEEVPFMPRLSFEPYQFKRPLNVPIQLYLGSTRPDIELPLDVTSLTENIKHRISYPMREGNMQYVKCAVCDGTGKEVCNYCGGSGRCPACGGTGKGKGFFGTAHCEVCCRWVVGRFDWDLSNIGRCIHCEGTGYLICRRCRGTGVIRLGSAY